MRPGPLLSIAFASLSCLLSLSPHAAAQALRVSTITFSGDDTPAADLLAASGLKTGLLDAAQVKAGAQKLSDTGMFDKVDFQVKAGVLDFKLQPTAERLPDHFENFAWWTDTALNEKVHAMVPLYHGKVAAGSGLDAQVTAALTAIAAEQHVKATVQATPEVDPETRRIAAVRYNILDPLISIGTVTISGGAAMQAELSAMAKGAAGQPFYRTTPDVLAQAVRSICDQHGYLDPAPTRVTAQSPVAAGDGFVVPLAMEVAEGQQFRVESIRFAQPAAVHGSEFQKNSTLHPGDVANQELLRRNLLLVSVPYARQGYLHAKVSTDRALDKSAARVTYTVKVEPGDLYHFGKLQLENLSDAQRAELLRVWKMQPGDPFDVSYAKGVLNANARQLHSLDGYSAKYKQVEHLDTHVVDLVMTFTKGGSLH